MTNKAQLINEVQKCASPYDFHRWRTPPIPGGWQCLIPQVLLTRLWIQDVVVYYLRRPRILTLANPVSNQKHKVLCRAIGQGITLARGQSSKESEFMSAVSTPPASTGRTSSAIRRLTTALKSSCYSYVPRSQMKTTLLPNEVHKEVVRFNTK